MSGTSLDGVDVAILTTDGSRVSEFGPSRTYPYGEGDRQLLRQAYADARRLEHREDRFGALAEAEVLVTRRHAEAVEAFLADANIRGGADIVGFHGQTVFHEPGRALTVQIGDGQSLADRLGIPVAWDFRAADMAAGGQGAPLAPIFHAALAAAAGLAGPIAFLNLGGVANVTYVGADGELIAFDTGPGNGLLDDWLFQRRGEPFDLDGQLAASGRSVADLVRQFLGHPYFTLPPPKSLDRNSFSLASLAGLSDEDGAATLLQFTAQSVAASVRHLPAVPRGWYVSGGGSHNVELMRVLRSLLPNAVQPLETLGFDGDATEAQAFALLAVRVQAQMPLSFPMTTGVPRPLPGGRISWSARWD